MHLTPDTTADCSRWLATRVPRTHANACRLARIRSRPARVSVALLVRWVGVMYLRCSNGRQGWRTGSNVHPRAAH